MESLRHISIGLCTPTLLPLLRPRKPSKLPHPSTSVACPASKWAERLLADFQFLPTTDNSYSSSSPSAASVSPPFPPLLSPSPPERHDSIPLNFYKVPGALCVLQEAGETKLVLQVGESLLRERLPKAFKQDVVLAMALAYVDLSRMLWLKIRQILLVAVRCLRALRLLQVLEHPFLLPFANVPLMIKIVFDYVVV